MELSSIIVNDMKKVPRPLNCFMTYRLEKQREILEQCPGANHRDISKITAKWWKNMTIAEKEPYRRRAEQAKNEHERLYPDYKFTPKKKLAKTRVYKKRSESEYTSEDLRQKHQLAILYYHGMPSSLSASSEDKTFKHSSYSYSDNMVSLREKEGYRPYIPIINRHNDYNTTFTNSSEISQVNSMAESYGRLSPSTSSSNKSSYSTLQNRPATTTINNSDTRPPPYAIPSQSTTPSLSPSNVSSHHTSNPLGPLSALEKINNKSCNDFLNSSNRFYGSTNFLQEPPSDPFNSPYNNNTRISSNRDFNNNPRQSGSSSILPLFNHLRHHLPHGEVAADVYSANKKGNGDDVRAQTGVDRHSRIDALFHSDNSFKSSHSHLYSNSVYHSASNY